MAVLKLRGNSLDSAFKVRQFFPPLSGSDRLTHRLFWGVKPSSLSGSQTLGLRLELAISSPRSPACWLYTVRLVNLHNCSSLYILRLFLLRTLTNPYIQNLKVLQAKPSKKWIWGFLGLNLSGQTDNELEILLRHKVYIPRSFTRPPDISNS